ncbi:MAG: transcription elongation factor GreA [Dehalococcoidia bacterium]
MVKEKTVVAASSLGEAAAKYVATLNADATRDAQPAVNRFVQWFGAEKRVADLRGPDIERFVEESAGRGGSQGRRIETVRPFLVYLRSTGQTEINLSAAMKIRRSDTEAGVAERADQVQMTREGHEALTRELEELIDQRPIIAEALKEAMADKDFRENSPLDAARDQQAHVEAAIRRVQQLLKHAVIVDKDSGTNGVARVGSFVVVRDVKSAQTTRYHLVSPSEVNLKERKISVASPVGKALMDHVQGDEVTVHVPAGVLQLRVEAVET